MPHKLIVANFDQKPLEIDLASGTTTIIVGANGSGKSRLAAYAEERFGKDAHRISAHRSLSLNPAVPKINETKAKRGLRFGYAEVEESAGINFRNGRRWQGGAATALLNDFDFLLQALFAEQSNIALRTHYDVHAGRGEEPKLTSFQRLYAIWIKLLPHRILEISGDDILCKLGDKEPYSAQQMSDGERAIFYILGQVLVAEMGSVLIFDEPELHVHRSILSKLWDEIEAVRPDCAFLVITHDLDFAASRPGQKFVLRGYSSPENWQIEAVPEETGFSEELTTLILGSRSPILFVEGSGSSLDRAVYRACFPDWTVVPIGSSESVIHSVSAMRKNSSLVRISCAGIVDADGRTQDEEKLLSERGIASLPVSEIENLFLMPEVVKEILILESFREEEVLAKGEMLIGKIFEFVSSEGVIEEVVLRHCARRLDRAFKRIDLNRSGSVEVMKCRFHEGVALVNLEAIANEVREKIGRCVRERDIKGLLQHFDNKTLLAIAATQLKGTSRSNFEEWLSRAIRDPKSERLKSVVRALLPTVNAL